MPKVGRFFKIVKIRKFCCFITWLIKKLQKQSLHEVIETILLFVVNTIPLLRDIWLLRYLVNNFNIFWKDYKSNLHSWSGCQNNVC